MGFLIGQNHLGYVVRSMYRSGGGLVGSESVLCSLLDSVVDQFFRIWILKKTEVV